MLEAIRDLVADVLEVAGSAFGIFYKFFTKLALAARAVEVKGASSGS